MTYTAGSLTTRVQQRIKDTNYSSTEIKSYLTDVQNDICNEYTLPFMETTQTYTLTPNVSDITNGSGLPTNYAQALDIILTTAGREKVLPNVDIREVDNVNPDADDTTVNPAGPPQYWYKYGNTIKVYPVPDSAYTLTLRYIKKPTDLTEDADVPVIPSEFQEILVVGAGYRVLQVKDNYDQAAILQNKYDEILSKLVVKYSQDQIGSPYVIRTNRYAVGKAHF